MTLFDHAAAERLKAEGMARAAASRPALLAAAQHVAQRLAALHGEVDSDMVAREMEAGGIDYAALGNAAGSVFKNPPEGFRWEWTGGVRTSERVSTHGRVIRVWRLARVEP